MPLIKKPYSLQNTEITARVLDNWADSLIRQLNNVVTAGSIQIFTSSGSSSSGGSGGSLVFRAGTVVLAAGSTPITFSSSMGSTDYTLVTRAYDVANASIGINVTAKTLNGFTAKVVKSCTLEYFVIGSA